MNKTFLLLSMYRTVSSKEKKKHHFIALYKGVQKNKEKKKAFLQHLQRAFMGVYFI